MTPAVVVVQSAVHADSEDARFALRELQRAWRTPPRFLIGMDWRTASLYLPPTLPGPVLILRSPLLTLEARCLERLANALAAGADIALACDSSAPGPMAAPNYATVRGMERYVDAQRHGIEPMPPDADAAVELATVDGLLRRAAGSAKLVRVAGAWAHDSSTYFSSARPEVLALLPDRLGRMLDVGGGEGAFLAAVKQSRPGLHTTLIELTTDAAATARARGNVDVVHQANFIGWRTSERFDCISFLDVLEHMPDPERALAHARSLLAPGGTILVSVPNVGHATVIADLLEGRWDWAPAGIHCYTHLRFFTRATLLHLLERAGLAVRRWHDVEVPCPPEWRQAWDSPALRVDSASIGIYAFLALVEPVT